MHIEVYGERFCLLLKRANAILPPLRESVFRPDLAETETDMPEDLGGLINFS
jgi:hypothetical protein